jgi:hypothetical protein
VVDVVEIGGACGMWGVCCCSVWLCRSFEACAFGLALLLLGLGMLSAALMSAERQCCANDFEAFLGFRFGWGGRRWTAISGFGFGTGC